MGKQRFMSAVSWANAISPTELSCLFLLPFFTPIHFRGTFLSFVLKFILSFCNFFFLVLGQSRLFLTEEKIINSFELATYSAQGTVRGAVWYKK